MLREKARADEDDGDVVRVAVTQDRILIDVDFAKGCPKPRKQRRDRGFSFLAEMAPRTRVQSNLARPRHREAPGFRTTVEIGAIVAKESGLRHFRNGVENGFALLRRIAANKFEEGVEVERNALELIEGGENALSDSFHLFAPLLKFKA